MLNTADVIAAGTILILAAASFFRAPGALRIGAVAAGALGLAYAALIRSWPLAVAPALLLGVNAWRLRDVWLLHRRIRDARAEAIDPRAFEEYFRQERHARGDTLFLKGNPGDYAYYVSRGEVSIPEVAATVGPGEFFGEFSLFTDSGLRTASAVCGTDVELYRIDAQMLAATFHRKPDFAFALVRLIVQRMNRNNERLSGENATLRLDKRLASPRVL